jgi:putative transcriptional regulator
VKMRPLANELMEGVAAMAAHRYGRITLRTHEIEMLPPLAVSGSLIRLTRQVSTTRRSGFAPGRKVGDRQWANPIASLRRKVK